MNMMNLKSLGKMNKLPENFKVESLGLTVRLVNEGDVDYILSLRTNKFLTRFIHQTDDDRDAQIEWIRRYKQREAEGREYYFIYLLNGNPIGVNRIYNIFEYYGTIGSWICNPGNEAELSLKTYILMFDMMFEHIKLDITLFDFMASSILSFAEFCSFLFLFLFRLRFRLSEYNFCLLLNELKFEEFFLMVFNTNDILKIIKI